MKAPRLAGGLLLVIATLLGAGVEAARESRISATKHNLSASGTGTTHSTSESQICVFCHTPHGADISQPAPLWNKTLQNTTYTPYTSSSLDAATIQGASAGQPLGSSKLCLSCHDGVMALGSVRVLRGQQNQTIGGGTQVAMPAGSGQTTGYTRLLGTDLSNDHPISVTFDATLSDRDGELRRPTMSTGASGQTLNRWGTVFGARAQHDSYRPLLPLEPTGASGAGQVQCTSCHDPHIRETSLTAERNIKFLRANRFQKAQPTSSYSATNDILCLACHDKGMQGVAGNSWVYSAHANSLVATQTYKTAAADTREFPSTTSGATSNIAVWQAACLNCHDTHSVSGSRRLLREGTDDTAATALYLGGFKAGGNAALEETCYQCHTDTTTSILNSATNNPPNIKQDFARTYRMPIRSVDQPAGGSETHSIGGSSNDAYNDCTNAANKCGADLIESRTLLGNGDANNRHVECSDCHNPHRVVKFQRFDGNSGNITGAPDTSGSHKHLTDSSVVHTNIASGVLRGSWGVEPIYTTNNASFQLGAIDFTVRRSDPGTDTLVYDAAQVHPADSKSYVTREYQICLKCHSSYGYGSTPPTLYPTNSKGLTASGTNNVTQYTDQAKEFQAPTTHKGSVNQGPTTDSGSATSYTNNHRSWHPVMGSTGRTSSERGNTPVSNWNHPWQNLGTQTMYCSDCHGSAVTSSTSVIPNSGNAWGPHGSSNPFILKGTWDGGTSETTTICFKCHSYTRYATRGGGTSGFGGSKDSNLHSYHADKIGRMRCNWCHVAVPHGWKNKALLVNLNDVGPEAGLAAGTQVRNGTTAAYNRGSYYFNAYLKIITFQKSGQWSEGDCGSKGAPGNGDTGRDWMRDSTENCKNPP